MASQTFHVDSRRWIRRRGRMPGALLCTAALTLPFLAVPSVRADDMVKLAGELATLRGDVEGLSGDLSQESTRLKDDLRAGSRQKNDLAVELDRERIRLQKLRMTIAQRQARVKQHQSGSESLKPIYERTLEGVRTYISTALPFRQGERQAELSRLDTQVRNGLLTPERALARLWNFIEDEFRMTRESGLFRQAIRLDGQERLADVVRIGMVMLFFRTGDGTLGHAVREDAGWSYVRVSDPQEQKRVQGLFDAFKKQVRVGYFEIPTALPKQGGK